MFGGGGLSYIQLTVGLKFRRELDTNTTSETVKHIFLTANADRRAVSFTLAY